MNDNLKYEIENALLEKRNLIVDKEIQLHILNTGKNDDQINAVNTIQLIDETLALNENHLQNLLNAMPR